jgi:DNA-binding NarL/FixJ family response regulator
VLGSVEGISATSSTPLRTVLVDDSDDLRQLLRGVLTRDGRFVVVGEIDNGLDAIALVAAEQPDLVVLDIAMPQLDGIAALPRLRAVSPDTRVVMLSGYKADEMERASIEGGAVGYIDKSTDVAVLPDRLHALAGVLDAVQRVLDLTYDADVESPRQARRDVKAALAAAAGASSVDVIELLTSELVTNAVRHANSAARVAVEVVGAKVRVSVTDDGPGVPATARPSPDAESGRGLDLVQGLADRWGVIALDVGKTVWFEADVSA